MAAGAPEKPLSSPAIAAPTLWQNADFVKFWLARTVSDFGSMITGVALPLTAAIYLSASPGQMGVLTALGELPVLVVGLLAGAWVDRVRRRPVMVSTDIARGILLLAVPLAAIAGVLAMWQLYVVAALAGGLAIFFDVAASSYLPSLVSRDDLLEGNSKLNAGNSIAEVSGPPAGGVLVQLLTAPLAIFIDAVSFFVSAALVILVRKPEPEPEKQEQRDMVRDVKEGLRFVVQHPVLRALAGNEATTVFFGNFIGVSYTLFVLNDLGLSPVLLGVLIGAGGAGALVGAMIARRITARYGTGRVLSGVVIFSGLLNLTMPFVRGSVVPVTAIMIGIQFVGDIAWALYYIQSISLRQSLVPDRLLGRASASTRFLIAAVGPVGALLAGALGDRIGLRPTLFIGAAGIAVSALWFLLSPVKDQT